MKLHLILQESVLFLLVIPLANDALIIHLFVRSFRLLLDEVLFYHDALCEVDLVDRKKVDVAALFDLVVALADVSLVGVVLPLEMHDYVVVFVININLSHFQLLVTNCAFVS